MSSDWATLPVQPVLSAFPVLPGVTISQGLSILVTSGNSHTVALAIGASLTAVRQSGLDPAQAVTADLGAYGLAGPACAWLLARCAPHLAMVCHRMDRLQEIRRIIEGGVVGVPGEADSGILDCSQVGTA